MAEGPFHPLQLDAGEVEALTWLLDELDRVWPQKGLQREVLRAALERSAPGTMQTQTGLPVHAARAGAGRALTPVCDVEALGVVTTDRNLIECEACVTLIDEAVRFPCPLRCNEGYVERLATPEEVDDGFELGVAFDPCPACNPASAAVATKSRRGDVEPA